MDIKKGLPQDFSGLPEEAKKELVDKIGLTARENERIYHGCARSVLNAIQSHLDLDSHAISTLVKAAVPLGGGVARTGEACGALLGGLMAIGLFFDSGRMEDARNSPSYQEAVRRAMIFSDRFKAEIGALRCQDVHKVLFGRSYDLRKVEDREDFHKSDSLRCEEVVEKAARLASEVILDVQPQTETEKDRDSHGEVYEKIIGQAG